MCENFRNNRGMAVQNARFLLDNSDQEDEGDVPMAQRKRFTRVEMARVLMERNQVSDFNDNYSQRN